MNKRVTVYPMISDEMLTNPGIGFTTAPGLMGDPERIVDNRGKRSANTSLRKTAGRTIIRTAKYISAAFVGVTSKRIKGVTTGACWKKSWITPNH